MSTSALPNGEENSKAKPRPRYIDIGINLTDPVYSGLYYEKQRHPSDLSSVISRARVAGCEKLLVTGSDLAESKKALELAEQYPGYIYTTLGVHPCSCKQFITSPNTPEAYLSSLSTLLQSPLAQSHLKAYGEIGLDYDRLQHCPKETQLEYFSAQLELFTSPSLPSPPLPLFLHSRAAHSDFVSILKKYLDKLPRRGVVHSFTGTVEEMQELVELGFDIGINGCSLKTEENLELVRQLPLERIQLETDGPWCEVRSSSAGAKFLKGWEEEVEGLVDGGEKGAWKSVKKEKWVEGAMIKGRNESCMIGKVAWIVAGVKGKSIEEVREKAWENSMKMFGLGENGV